MLSKYNTNLHFLKFETILSVKKSIQFGFNNSTQKTKLIQNMKMVWLRVSPIGKNTSDACI